MVDDEPRLLIPPEFYFQATCDVGYRDKLREQIEQGRHPERLTELPSLTFASQRTGQPPAVAVGWNDSGIAIEIRVSGKKHPWPPHFQPGVKNGDLLSICLDTRDMKSNRRPNRFCHLIRVLPARPRSAGIQVEQLPMHTRPSQSLASEARLVPHHFISQANSYRVSLWLDREAILGYDPENVPSLGFYYHFQDESLGDYSFGLGESVSPMSDPSLWPSLRLIR